MDRIEIKGYKSIKELDFEVKPINILIGANGAGKSNFISFFKFLNVLYEQNLANYVAENGGVDKFLFQGRKATKSINFKISFDDHNNDYGVKLTTGSRNFVVADELLYYKNEPRDIANAYQEAQIKSDTKFRAKYIRNYLLESRVYHFHDVGKDSPFNSSSRISDKLILSSTGVNIASILYDLQNNHRKTYQRIVETIQIVAPYFSDFILEPIDQYVSLGWKEKGNEILYGASDFSDGTMRFVALVTLFMQTKLPKTIIIDEPELGLHPVAINVLASLIKGAARQGTQVIVATQSVELINEFEPQDIVVVDRMGGASVFARLSDDELSGWLDDYTVGTLWVKNIINKGQPSR